METDASDDSVDQVVRDLQRLRGEAGGPSYAEIVRRVAALREASGVPDRLARPARTTVYDAFRQDRTRLDADLVADIAQALGGDGDHFRQRCLHVRLASEVIATTPPVRPDRAADPSPATAPDAPARPAPAPRPADDETVGRETAYRALVLLGCLALNLLGYATVEAFDLTIFLDMAGTGIAAIALGPWHGVLVAIATHLVGTGLHGLTTVPFVVVNIAGALVWGYGVRRFGQGRSLPRFFGLTVLVGLVCTSLATPLLLLLFGGDTGHSAGFVNGLTALGEPHWLAVLHANLMMSLADKLLSGFLILTVVSVLSCRTPVPGGHLFAVLGRLDRGARDPGLRGGAPARGGDA